MKATVIIITLLAILNISFAERSNKEIQIQKFLNLLESKDIKVNDTACWLNAIARGVGKPIHACKNNYDLNGLLCYPKCQENYTGVGPVCWQNCPENLRDDGAYCFKSTTYDRPSYIDQDKCNNEHKDVGCEEYLGLWYPKCKSSFYNVGCCYCEPFCPDKMTDIGISCQKDSYGRGAGEPMTCSAEEVYDTGLCYNHCQDESKYIGIGPVCWQKECPNGYQKCGALCLKDEECTDKVKEYMSEVIEIITKFAEKDYVGAIIDVAKFVKDFIYPNCQVEKVEEIIERTK